MRRETLQTVSAVTVAIGTVFLVILGVLAHFIGG
jgi:hypothetical protein